MEVHTYTCTCTHTRVHAFIHVYSHTRIYIYMHSYMPSHSHTCARIHICTRTHTYTCAHVHTHTQSHACMHAHPPFSDQGKPEACLHTCTGHSPGHLQNPPRGNNTGKTAYGPSSLHSPGFAALRPLLWSHTPERSWILLKSSVLGQGAARLTL